MHPAMPGHGVAPARRAPWRARVRLLNCAWRAYRTSVAIAATTRVVLAAGAARPECVAIRCGCLVQGLEPEIGRVQLGQCLDQCAAAQMRGDQIVGEHRNSLTGQRGPAQRHCIVGLESGQDLDAHQALGARNSQGRPEVANTRQSWSSNCAGVSGIARRSRYAGDAHRRRWMRHSGWSCTCPYDSGRAPMAMSKPSSAGLTAPVPAGVRPARSCRLLRWQQMP